MSTYQSKPTYYRVTWNLTSPTNYSSKGGIIPFNSVQMNNTVAITGITSSPSVSTGDILSCNDYNIGPFISTDSLSNITADFNNVTQYTGVMASQTFPNYITLQSTNPANGIIALNDVTGTPVEELGLVAAGSFKYSNPIYGGTFSSPTNNNNVVINGTNITFVTGALTAAGVVTTINKYTASTGVVATQASSNIQLNSVSGCPIYFGAGTTGTSAAIGFADNTIYGGAMTQAQAVVIEQANMCWNGLISSVESIITPIYWDSIVMTGTNVTDGSALPLTVSWTIGVSDPKQLVTATLAGEPETTGTLLYDIAALTRLLARALTGTWSENRKVYNNTLTQIGTYASRENPVVVQLVTATALDTSANIHNLEGNFTITLIPNA